MCGWSSRAAASASTRKRRTSSGASAPARSRFSATTRSEPDLAGPVDDPHPAPAQLVEQLAIADPAADVGRLDRRRPGEGVRRRQLSPSAGQRPRRSGRRPRARGARRPGPGRRRGASTSGARRRSERRRSASASSGGEPLGPGRRSSAETPPIDGDSPSRSLQPTQGPEVPHAGGRLAEAEDPGGLGVAELLEVAEQDDLAVGLVELVDRVAEPAPELVAEGRGGGRQLGVAELGGQVERRAIGEGRRQRPLAVEAPTTGDPVPPVRVDQVVAGDLPEPEVERQGRVGRGTPAAAGWPGAGRPGRRRWRRPAAPGPGRGAGRPSAAGAPDAAPRAAASAAASSSGDALQQCLRLARVGPHRVGQSRVRIPPRVYRPGASPATIAGLAVISRAGRLRIGPPSRLTSVDAGPVAALAPTGRRRPGAIARCPLRSRTEMPCTSFTPTWPT